MPSAYPSLVCSSDRFRPKAITLIRTHPGGGSGTGRSRIWRFSTGPGASSTTARIVSVICRFLPVSCCARGQAVLMAEGCSVNGVMVMAM